MTSQNVTRVRVNASFATWPCSWNRSAWFGFSLPPAGESSVQIGYAHKIRGRGR